VRLTTPEVLLTVPALTALGAWWIARLNLTGAHDGRLWERKADAYVSVLAWLNGWDDERQSLRDSMRSDHADPWPADRRGLADVIARVDAFGSKQVRDELARVSEADRYFVHSYGKFLQDQEARTIRPEYLPTWTDDIDRTLADAATIHDQLSALIRDELASRRPVRWWARLRQGRARGAREQLMLTNDQ
jgi:hypothetical protein